LVDGFAGILRPGHFRQCLGQSLPSPLLEPTRTHGAVHFYRAIDSYQESVVESDQLADLVTSSFLAEAHLRFFHDICRTEDDVHARSIWQSCSEAIQLDLALAALLLPQVLQGGISEI